MLRGTASNRWRFFAICAGLTAATVAAAVIVMQGYDEPDLVTGTAFPEALPSTLGPDGSSSDHLIAGDRVGAGVAITA